MTSPFDERLQMLHAILVRLNEGGYVGWGGVEQAEREILSLFREMVEKADPLKPKGNSIVMAQQPYMNGIDDYKANLLQQLGEEK